MSLRPFLGHALRDASLVMLTMLLWRMHEAAGIATGLATGLCFLLLHEWGHLCGAVRAAAPVHPGPLWGIFLFDVDHQRQSRTQFLSLSFWGFAATGVMLIGFWLWMPWDSSAGRWSWYTALALTTLTILIEFPIAWRVYRGHPIPNVAIFRR